VEDGLLKGANVRYLGVFPRSELGRVLGDVEYVLVPFPPTVFNEAAVPIKLMEGMAAGCVCVCSSRAGIREIVAHLSNGVLVEDDTPKGWADAILRLQHEPALRSQLGDRARSTIREQYTWDALALEFEKGLIEGWSRFAAAHGQHHHRRL
jgi:glycosyltransferase involved in cell wall biosynthesis